MTAQYWIINLLLRYQTNLLNSNTDAILNTKDWNFISDISNFGIAILIFLIPITLENLNAITSKYTDSVSEKNYLFKIFISKLFYWATISIGIISFIVSFSFNLIINTYPNLLSNNAQTFLLLTIIILLFTLIGLFLNYITQIYYLSTDSALIIRKIAFEKLNRVRIDFNEKEYKESILLINILIKGSLKERNLDNIKSLYQNIFESFLTIGFIDKRYVKTFLNEVKINYFEAELSGFYDQNEINKCFLIPTLLLVKLNNVEVAKLILELFQEIYLKNLNKNLTNERSPDFSFCGWYFDLVFMGFEEYNSSFNLKVELLELLDKFLVKNLKYALQNEDINSIKYFISNSKKYTLKINEIKKLSAESLNIENELIHELSNKINFLAQNLNNYTNYQQIILYLAEINELIINNQKNDFAISLIENYKDKILLEYKSCNLKKLILFLAGYSIYEEKYFIANQIFKNSEILNITLEGFLKLTLLNSEYLEWFGRELDDNFNSNLYISIAVIVYLSLNLYSNKFNIDNMSEILDQIEKAKWSEIANINEVIENYFNLELTKTLLENFQVNSEGIAYIRSYISKIKELISFSKNPFFDSSKQDLQLEVTNKFTELFRKKFLDKLVVRNILQSYNSELIIRNNNYIFDDTNLNTNFFTNIIIDKKYFSLKRINEISNIINNSSKNLAEYENRTVIHQLYENSIEITEINLIKFINNLKEKNDYIIFCSRKTFYSKLVDLPELTPNWQIADNIKERFSKYNFKGYIQLNNYNLINIPIFTLGNILTYGEILLINKNKIGNLVLPANYDDMIQENTFHSLDKDFYIIIANLIEQLRFEITFKSKFIVAPNPEHYKFTFLDDQQESVLPGLSKSQGKSD
jgi:hypothetical protein